MNNEMTIATINAMTAEEMRAELLRQHAQGFYTWEGKDVLPARKCGCTEEHFMAGISSPAFIAGWNEAEARLGGPQDGNAKPNRFAGMIIRFRSIVFGV